MPATKRPARKSRLPRLYPELMRHMPPRAIVDDAQYQSTLAMIDRLMASGKLTADQADYLETLVQLVQAYESAHDPIDVSDLSGLDMLRHLLDENEMNASDLARLLGVHASMGSKILNGDCALTLDHIRTPAARFQVSAELFIS